METPAEVEAHVLLGAQDGRVWRGWRCEQSRFLGARCGVGVRGGGSDGPGGHQRVKLVSFRLCLLPVSIPAGP